MSSLTQQGEQSTTASSAPAQHQTLPTAQQTPPRRTELALTSLPSLRGSSRRLLGLVLPAHRHPRDHREMKRPMKSSRGESGLIPTTCLGMCLKSCWSLKLPMFTAGGHGSAVLLVLRWVISLRIFLALLLVGLLETVWVLSGMQRERVLRRYSPLCRGHRRRRSCALLHSRCWEAWLRDS